ncbi:hypothetical protein CJD36_008190 [Flavipsychrobacter stenotrophus]|uniref:Uncharacterized protein n=1 Tax=Flavipsychrobacter stenotrophus TaxID=2077091 RepID=A0A2S7SYH4_9BACT|nr:LacI family DNA-binding transcriptional regulator [Flavipsychrobacter stenotrophus]PQJ11764.1 hypothetical protein CJD36_008190 [Flavipsychrobacter stenotrophus]
MQQVVKKQNEIKASIPYGGFKEIAASANTSVYTVSRVVNGKSRNRKVLAEINNYLAGLRNDKETLQDNLKAVNE